MSPETVSLLAEELAREYPGSAMARDGQTVFVRLPEVAFPPGCNPPSASALVILDPQQPTPKLLLKSAPTLSNGRTGRNINSETVGGEGWYVFSFSQPWDEKSNTARQYVESRLRRFALSD